MACEGKARVLPYCISAVYETDVGWSSCLSFLLSLYIVGSSQCMLPFLPCFCTFYQSILRVHEFKSIAECFPLILVHVRYACLRVLYECTVYM